MKFSISLSLICLAVAGVSAVPIKHTTAPCSDKAAPTDVGAHYGGGNYGGHGGGADGTATTEIAPETTVGAIPTHPPDEGADGTQTTELAPDTTEDAVPTNPPVEGADGSMTTETAPEATDGASPTDQPDGGSDSTVTTELAPDATEDATPTDQSDDGSDSTNTTELAPDATEDATPTDQPVDGGDATITTELAPDATNPPSGDGDATTTTESGPDATDDATPTTEPGEGDDKATPPLFSCKPTATISPEGKKTHYVIVGGEDVLRYDPAFVRADPGDTVRFHFLARNHTLTESTFDTPCIAKPDGIDSDFQPNPNNDIVNPPTFEVEVKDTKPKWFYCRQGNHCTQGMVFAINPQKATTPPPPPGTPETANTYIRFLSNAIKSGCDATAVPKF